MKPALVLLALALSACASAGSSPSSAPLDAFDQTMRRWMTAHNVPRGSVAVMRDNRLVFAAGCGGRRPDERVPVWSMSKAITAVAWFASYDGVHADTEPDAVRALHEALWQAHRRVWTWPAHDQFPTMGVEPLV